MIRSEIFLINNSLAIISILFFYVFFYWSFWFLQNIEISKNITHPFSSSSIDDVYVNI